MIIPPIYKAIVIMLPTPVLDPRKRVFLSRAARRKFERTGKIEPDEFVYVEVLNYEPDPANI